MQNFGVRPEIRMSHNLFDYKSLGSIRTWWIGDVRGGVPEPLSKLARLHPRLDRQPCQNTLVGEILRLQPNHIHDIQAS